MSWSLSARSLVFVCYTITRMLCYDKGLRIVTFLGYHPRSFLYGLTRNPPNPSPGYHTLRFCFIVVLRPWKRDGLLWTGTEWEGSTAETARKRPERPWTAARTMEVLRRCPVAIAQRLVHCAIAVSTAVLGQSHKDNVRCTAVEKRLEAKEVQLSLPSTTSLLMISSGLT